MHENTELKKQRYFDWQWVQAACMITANKIKADHPNYKEQFAGIVAFPRGGLIPATILAHLLDLEQVMTISELDLQIDGSLELASGTYLLVDDISDSGRTFADFVAGYSDLINSGEIKFITASLFYRPDTAFMPDYTVQNAFDYWIVFPWEV